MPFAFETPAGVIQTVFADDTKGAAAKVAKLLAEQQQAFPFEATKAYVFSLTHKVVATIAVGSFPLGVAVTPDGNHAYVANGSSDTVSVIATNKVAATVKVGKSPNGVGIVPPQLNAPQ